MSKSARLLFVTSAIYPWVAGCGSSAGPAQAPNQAPPDSAIAPRSSGEAPSTRPTLTAEACESSGGAVVGDIGDGATQRPEYRCANGAKPTGNVGASHGGPIAIEGSVCCPR